MAITDLTATPAPPVSHYHVYTGTETLADLNAWLVALYSPQFSESKPPFTQDDDGIHYFDGVQFSAQPIVAGWVIVVDPFGRIFAISSDQFAAEFITK